MIGRMAQSWKLTKRPVLGFEGGDFSSASFAAVSISISHLRCRLDDLADGCPARRAILVTNVDHHGAPSEKKRLTLFSRRALDDEIG